MISDVLSVIDRLIKLKEYREKRQSKRFDKIIEPTFNELLLIHLDYIKMFEKVDELLPDPTTSKRSPKYRKGLQRAASYLAEKRLELEPLREKNRALTSMMQLSGKKISENQDFVMAVATYLSTGSQGPTSIGSVARDVLSQVRNDRDDMQQYVAGILSRLRLNWSRVTEEYSKLKLASAERE